MRPSESGFQPNVVMSDRELAQVTFAFRIFDPDVDISYSTREEHSFRNNMATLGVTTMSAGSHTEPGGYARADQELAQFDISDATSPAEVAADLSRLGREPVWKRLGPDIRHLIDQLIMTPITSTSASPFDAPAGAWSHEAWRAGERAYKAILHLPFVTELTAGNLSRERFMRYISQDSLYLGQYSRVLAHIASRTGDPSVRSAFLKFAADGVAVEQALHQSFLDGMTAGSPAPRMSPACLFYTSPQINGL